MPRKSKTTRDKSFSYNFGNMLLAVGLLLFFLIFYPIIKAYVFPPRIAAQSELKGDYITVAKIHAQAPLITNVDPFNQPVYREVLKHGVAQAKGTSLPGQKGTVFTFAHSSGTTLEETNYNTIFLRLGELQKGDEILVKYKGKVYGYRVQEKKIVYPSEIKYLKEKKDQLIVQTCWPIGTSLRRLLVFATPEK
jgi:sortase A